MIRTANRNDASKISELIYIIWNDMELPLIQDNDKSVVLDVIKQSIEEGHYRNYFEHIHVFEVEGEVAGFINTYDGGDEEALESNWNKIDFKQDFKLEGTPLPEKEADKGDLYIESIAVFSDYRGQGIASKLIEYIFNYGKEKGFKNVSLNCEVENEGAMKLYRKFGFEPSYDRVLSGHDYKYMIKTI